MKKYVAWAKQKGTNNEFVQTYLPANNIKEARAKFKSDYDLDSKVSLSKNN